MKGDLINAAVKQIKADLADNDETAISELLSFLPDDRLRNFLSETSSNNAGDDLTELEKNVLRGLRQRGFAVIAWTPEELGDADPRRVEDRSIELGHEVIDTLRSGDDEAADEGDESRERP